MTRFAVESGESRCWGPCDPCPPAADPSHAFTESATGRGCSFLLLLSSPPLQLLSLLHSPPFPTTVPTVASSSSHVERDAALGSMSLSLSSLLNPSPDADGNDQPSSTASTAAARKDSLPPVSYVQSPEQAHASVLPGTRQDSNRTADPDQDAIQGLAAVAGSPPAPSTSQWYGQQPGFERRSSSFERRPGSSGMQLPMPSSDGRKMSSPTLEHYHVPSRSPEQGKVPLAQGMTLPPLQRFTSGEDAAQAHASEQSTSLRQSAGEADANADSISRDDIASSESQSKPLSPTQLGKTSPIAAPEDMGSSSAAVKEETAPTPPVSSPTEARRMSAHQEMDGQTHKTVVTLKTEHSAITQSPLRESSVPVPSTEVTAPEVTIPKKRPAPTKKKGTATMTNKKAPPAKKRKVEPKRSATPSSVASKTPASKLMSSKGTPANSSPAPSTRSQSAEPNDEPYDDDDEDMEDGDVDSDDVYCLCRKPDTGTFMIGCDGTCDDWFHGKCVGIEERDKNLIDKYICPNCQKAGIGRTTWKRICRREGCRLPARIGKSKNGKDGSKYCSDECGVRYFREMVAKTRGKEEMGKNRASRRKGSITSHERPSMDDDLGARGGLLAAGELKALVTSSKSADDFKKLGEGVLSPPATPDAKKRSHSQYDEALTESEAAAVQAISRQKDAAREKHQLLKDRMKFVTMVKQAASRTATEKELKPKEYCGYDSRLEWTDAQFDRWRSSTVGKQAFELETLAVADDTAVEDHNEDFDVCERKKCARHLEWNKLAVDDVRAHMSDNGDRMRELDREEREIRERAALRAKAGSLVGEGSVELHDPPSLPSSHADRKLGSEPDPVEVTDALETERPVEQVAVVESVEGANASPGAADGDAAMADTDPAPVSAT